MNTKLESSIYQRNELLWGEENQKNLFTKHVVVVGLGGVGSYAAEALARSGVGEFTIIDFDTVGESNINRQLLALTPDIGKQKTDLMKKRIEDINPHIKVNVINDFYTPIINEQIFNRKVDFVVDAIDTLRAKIDLLDACFKNNIPVISSMGAGNRLDPSQLYICDISEVKAGKCSFMRNVKYRLKTRGITEGLPVVISKEKPIPVEKIESTINYTTQNGETIELKKFTPGSSPFVPPVAGYIMASFIARKFIE